MCDECFYTGPFFKALIKTVWDGCVKQWCFLRSTWVRFHTWKQTWPTSRLSLAVDSHSSVAAWSDSLNQLQNRLSWERHKSALLHTQSRCSEIWLDFYGKHCTRELQTSLSMQMWRQCLEHLVTLSRFLRRWNKLPVLSLNSLALRNYSSAQN